MNAPVIGLCSELAALNASLGHAALVERTLSRVASTEDLVRLIHRYTLFNGNFAGGVTSLTGALHVRQDLFRDPAEPIAACADRSARIASHVFFAAEDEYYDRDDQKRITHRDLGQYVLKETVNHFGLDPHTFDHHYPVNASTQRALELIFDGYCINPSARSDDDLLRGLGFHIASEISADAEFNAIATWLRREHPALVERLTTASTHLGHSVYRWIGLHTFVEVEHHKHATTAATMALDFYAGPASKEQASAKILDGVRFFSDVLHQLFSGIIEQA